MRSIARSVAGWALLAAAGVLVLLAAGVEPARAHGIAAFQDRVLSAQAGSEPLTARASAAPTVTYWGMDGQPVRVLTTAYTRTEIQPLVDTLTSLPHGAEINSLDLFVATEREIDWICGTSGRACYDPYAKRVIVPGTQDPTATTPQEFVLAHEYGHHLANHRGNSPWSALYWGTKRWATHGEVCSGVRAGYFHPGAQGSHYWSNPGEAFAQAYAEMALPSVEVGWYYDARLTPDTGALRAVRLDATRPLRGPKRNHWRFSVGSQGPRSRLTKITTPLDGRLRIAVPEGHGRAVTIAILSPDSPKVLDRSIDAKNREVLTFNVCGERQLRVRVRVHRGNGAFVVRSLRP